MYTPLNIVNGFIPVTQLSYGESSILSLATKGTYSKYNSWRNGLLESLENFCAVCACGFDSHRKSVPYFKEHPAMGALIFYATWCKSKVWYKSRLNVFLMFFLGIFWLLEFFFISLHRQTEKMCSHTILNWCKSKLDGI